MSLTSDTSLPSLPSLSWERTLALLHQLGSPDSLCTLAAAEGVAPATRPRVNAHIHLPPNFSAFESVSQAIALGSDPMGVGADWPCDTLSFGIGRFVAHAARSQRREEPNEQLSRTGG